LLAAKHALGWQESPSFFVPEEVLSFYRQALPKGAVAESNWQRQMAAYQTTSPELHAELTRRIDGKLPKDWDKDIITFAPDSKGMATRAASGKVLNSLAPNLPELLGGSADLTPSTLTYLTNLGDFQKDTPTGRNFHYGVREHGMGSILNGMALHGGILPFGATFLGFSDYMRPTLRLAALSHVPTIFVFTHDSIGLGEDGPTHQPVEHLAALRAIPNLTVIRPADANEVAEAWRTAILNRHGPTTLIFSRQAIPTLDRTVYSPANNLSKGAYVLADLGKKPQLILMASGTEVSLITKAGELLAAEGISVRLVSFPSWELFSAQDKTYRDSVLLPNLTKRIAVEAGIRQGWEQWIGDKGLFIGMSEFGASAPAPILYEKFGITVEHIMQAAHQLLS
jgi:transketolase